ncbi:MAG: pyrimidine-nucleoside phosphorylase, partial [Sporomusaceae bacterium]|nr:pyrimidine-nucleoside phosphorylase [Sporomusaceae bacterium]
EFKGQTIDLAAGVLMACRVGGKIAAGQPLAELFAASDAKLAAAAPLLQSAVLIGPEPIASPPLLYGLVDEAGYHPLT